MAYVECEYCGKKVSNKQALWTHFVFKHPEKDVSLSDDDQVLHKCESVIKNKDTSDVKPHKKKPRLTKNCIDSSPSKSNVSDERNYDQENRHPNAKATEATQLKSSSFGTTRVSRRQKHSKPPRVSLSQINQQHAKVEIHENLFNLVFEKTTNDLLVEHMQSLQDKLNQLTRINVAEHERRKLESSAAMQDTLEDNKSASQPVDLGK
jgi:hypothetical protein